MRYSVTEEGPVTIISPDDEWVHSSVKEIMKNIVSDFIDAGKLNFVINMAGVTRFNDNGLSTMLLLSRIGKKAKGSVVFAALTPHANKFVQIYQVDRLLKIYHTIEEAISSFK